MVRVRPLAALPPAMQDSGSTAIPLDASLPHRVVVVFAAADLEQGGEDAGALEKVPGFEQGLFLLTCAP